MIATRSLQEMLHTAVSRATTVDRYASGVGLTLPASRYEDPPLPAVVGAAARATEYVSGLLARKGGGWPMREFVIGIATRDPSGTADGQEPTGVAFVPGAARPAAGEVAESPLFAPDGVDVETNEVNARLRGAVQASGGLPLDWAVTLHSSRLPEGARPTAAAAAVDLLRAGTLPPVSPDLAEAFSPSALAGREGSRPLGIERAWARVEQLEAYLGLELVARDLRNRLAEALAGGVMMRGSPPPWRTLVRDAVARRVELAGNAKGHQGGSWRPLVVHFVAACGQERVESGRSDLIEPGLLEAEDFRTVSDVKCCVPTTSLRDIRRSLLSVVTGYTCIGLCTGFFLRPG